MKFNQTNNNAGDVNNAITGKGDVVQTVGNQNKTEINQPQKGKLLVDALGQTQGRVEVAQGLIRQQGTSPWNLRSGLSSCCLLVQRSRPRSSRYGVSGNQRSLRLSVGRDKFYIEKHTATTVDDLSPLPFVAQAGIVHFSGHGDKEAIYLDDGQGWTHETRAEPLARLFSLCNDYVKCVVLNACYSEAQAKVIQSQVDYTIGMSKKIEDGQPSSLRSASMMPSGPTKVMKRRSGTGRRLSTSTIWTSTMFPNYTEGRNSVGRNSSTLTMCGTSRDSLRPISGLPAATVTSFASMEIPFGPTWSNIMETRTGP